MPIKVTQAHIDRVSVAADLLDAAPVSLQVLGRPTQINSKAITAYIAAVMDLASKSGGVLSGADIRPAVLLKDSSIFTKAKKTAADADSDVDVLDTGIYAVSGLARKPVVHNWPSAGIYSGVTALMGATGSSKSITLNDHLKPDILVRWGEVAEAYDELDTAVHISTLDELLIVCIGLGSLGFNVAVDSVRPLLFRLKGAASAGGIVAVFYSLLTDISNLFTQYDCSVVMVVNPMVDAEKIEYVFGQVMASTVGAILCADGKIVKTMFRTNKGRLFNGSAALVADVHVPNMDEPTSMRALDKPSIARVRPLELSNVDNDDTDRAPRRGAAFTL
ncbi:hypothetical protein [Pseudomonas phage phiNN]|uniref:Uncharacterized protein n=1 Tax=Pseudomonas phage phiNN TaxID=1603039 RepID=A0A0B4N6D1_9VIRU|nr:hypothetical protein [Pseudomonas phage phiNN]AIK68703.1 hypothetical protein [Pseudomonas phage phiNN]